MMAKKRLFDDDGSSGGEEAQPRAANIKINEEYARRFEHNMKRAEMHRRMPFNHHSFEPIHSSIHPCTNTDGF